MYRHEIIEEARQALKERRLNLGLKQKEVAIEASISANDMSRVECGWGRNGHAKLAEAALDRIEGRQNWIESIQAHVDEGGKLSHRNGIELLNELNRIKAHS